MFTLEDLVSGETLILLEEMEYDLTSFKNTKFTYVPDKTWLSNSQNSKGKLWDAGATPFPATEIS